MIAIYNAAEMSDEIRRRIMTRAQTDIGQVAETVRGVIAAVRARGDRALLEYTRMWDDPDYELERLVVQESEIETAYRETPKQTVDLIREQVALARRFHEAQRTRISDWEDESETGLRYGEKWTALDAVGLYVPGGKNPFPTVQQILAVAAQAAGCPRIVSCISPRGKNYEVLIAARECGLRELYRVSGAQAVAALAYGTETIKPVELIAGPGNPYVTAAKILCQERVAIDMPAGPSEAVILADDSVPAGLSLERKAEFLAADILARAEHGPDSAAVLVTPSRALAESVRAAAARQAETLSRQSYIAQALDTYSAIIVSADLRAAIDFTNEYAPEHLEILTAEPRAVLALIRNAGSVFLGHFNPVAAGDYASGVNHVLPTGAWARRSSAVGVWTFMKRVQYSELSPAALKRLEPIVSHIAAIEGLDAHARSVQIRCEEAK